MFIRCCRGGLVRHLNARVHPLADQNLSVEAAGCRHNRYMQCIVAVFSQASCSSPCSSHLHPISVCILPAVKCAGRLQFPRRPAVARRAHPICIPSASHLHPISSCIPPAVKCAGRRCCIRMRRSHCPVLWRAWSQVVILGTKSLSVWRAVRVALCASSA